MDNQRRIWAFALGYFGFYIPYSALTKALSKGMLPGMRGPVSGFEMLPATVITTAIVLPLIITALGWWRYARLIPGRDTFLSGIAFAVIIGTTTLAYTFPGISIVFALLLMRGGVLTIAPIVDLFFGRKVHWYSWTALALSFLALTVAFSEVGGYKMTIAAALNLAAYLGGYVFRLRFMSRIAKSRDEKANRRFFVEEGMSAMFALVAIPAVFALIGAGDTMQQLRRGFTTFLTGELAVPAFAIGFFYGCLCVFGTLIYLDCRENTFCIPVNRCSSLLSGVAASYALTFWLKQPPASAPQLIAAGIVVIAVCFLSVPTFRVKLQRVFIFVCSGNTSRSPMAQAICTSEIARRLGVSIEALAEKNIQVWSAGLTAKPGSPLTQDARNALAGIGVPAHQHASRNLSDEMVAPAEAIFVMTEKQRREVIERFPAAAHKVHCLAEQDLDDPTGSGPEAFLSLAETLQRLIRGVVGQAFSLSSTG
jgi:protein-tyrosine-phosphatase